MTVGIGFQCPDGVVLASDRQITKDGGLKYEEGKFFRGYYDEVQCGCTYAGYPANAKNLFDDISRPFV
jgi:20S proteasome alpha/beta subunit